MPDAEYLSTTVLVEAGEFELRIRGRVQQFDGYARVLPPAAQKAEEAPLPDLAPGEVLKLKDLEGVQHFTKPAPRYGEASLVRELEKRGIGRPSTYAAIISTIQERGYVSLVIRRFHAEKIGELVTDRLVEKFENPMDYGFTAEMERELDRGRRRTGSNGGKRSMSSTAISATSSARPGQCVAALAGGGGESGGDRRTPMSSARSAADPCRSVPPERASFSVVPVTACRRRIGALGH